MFKQLPRRFSSQPYFNVIRDTDQSGSTGVVTLQFNRPQSLNALSVDMGLEFQARLAELGKDKAIRALVLTGSGRAFSAGGDIAWLQERTNRSPSENAITMRSFYNLYFQSLMYRSLM